GGYYAPWLVLAGGKSVAAAEAALAAEIARMRDAPVTAAELAEAKNELLAQALRQRETFQGRAFVTLLPFNIPESRPLIVPSRLASLLPASSFVELNFRTYVRGPGGEPAIWFFSLDASSAVAVAGARAVYRLPYFRATMSHTIRGDRTVEFSSVRKGDGAGVRCTTVYRPSGTISPATPEGLDHFLVERYVLFAGSTQRLLRASVQHEPYPLQPAKVNELTQNLLELEGLGTAARLPASHYSAGVDVRISRPERVRSRP
ncbi:MAG: DUF2071 domain-containing protein, partial [Acidobacteria bacterium]|nr:DUF2071 domain-containing protein [Acidobacteriota bacterium]